jgi:hypothetical protein
MTNTNVHRTRAGFPAIAVTLLAALMVLAVPAAFAGSASASSPGSAPLTIWAYGAVKTVNFQGVSSAGWQYSGNATYGYSVILNQTNTTGSDFELTVNRTMGAMFQVHYCYPNCNSPKYYGNVSDHIYETVDAAANFTGAGFVDENGAAVAAIALNNSQSHLRANLTESSNTYIPGLGGLVAPRSHYLAVNVVASSTVDFMPGLGILPVNLSSAQNWNSTAGFVAQAAASYAYYLSSAGPFHSGHFGPVTGNLSVPASGNVSLIGSYSPADTTVLGGITYPEVALKVVGPFSVREGFILLPNSANLFGGASDQPWGAQNGTASASMSYLDARASLGGHLGIGASQWIYNSSTLGPSSALAGTSGPSDISSFLQPATDAAPTTTVQGQPESVSGAQAQQACLLTGSGCPAGNSLPGTGFHGIVGLLAIGVVLIVVVSVIALVVERRRMPPPTYPNAALYPPGHVRPAVRASPTTPPEPAEDDPLRNLW